MPDMKSELKKTMRGAVIGVAFFMAFYALFGHKPWQTVLWYTLDFGLAYLVTGTALAY